MSKFDYVSSRGTVLSLSANPLFDLIDIDGQTAIETDISSTVNGSADGDTVTNCQAQPRTVILTLRIKSDVDVELAKREVLRVVKLKQNGTLVWTQRERTVEITGIVEAVEMPRWTNEVTMQITLHCAQPFWEDIENVIQQINEKIDLHYFTTSNSDMLFFEEEGIPFGEYDTIRTKSFYNDGDVAVGMEITIVAVDTVTNPIIYDQDGYFFGIGYGTGNKKVTMNSGDIIVITTHKGKKTVTLNGESLFNKIKPNSTWLQLGAGDNTFTINSDDDNISNMSFSLIFKQRYI